MLFLLDYVYNYFGKRRFVESKVCNEEHNKIVFWATVISIDCMEKDTHQHTVIQRIM